MQYNPVVEIQNKIYHYSKKRRHIAEDMNNALAKGDFYTFYDLQSEYNVVWKMEEKFMKEKHKLECVPFKEMN